VTRTSTEISQEAKKIGKLAASAAIDNNAALQVLAALVEELADSVANLERKSKG